MRKLSNIPDCNIPASLWAEVSQQVDAAESIAVIGHVNPDADAIGSIAATVAALTQLGKRANGYIGDTAPIDSGLLRIPGAQDIRGIEHLPEADLYIVVDCGASSRTGALQGQLLAIAERVIVIDHHASNRGFGRWNIIDPEAESTTTILSTWFQRLGIVLSTDIAHCLYAGLATDTGSFMWGRPQMHTLAQYLLDQGLPVRSLSTELFDGGSVADLVMLGKVLSDLRAFRVDGSGAFPLHVGADQVCEEPIANAKIVVFAVASSDRIQGYTHSAVERIADVVRSMNNIDLAVVLKEYRYGEWTISLRSHGENVAAIATAFGGGGHLRSAGFSIFGSQEFVIAEILDVVADQNT